MVAEKKQLTKTAARRFTIVTVLALLLITAFVYDKGNDVRLQVDINKQRANGLRQEIDTGNIFSAVRADLDNLTMDDNNSTTLAILRHLDLQESKLEYRTKSKSTKNISGTDLILRKFILSGETTYQEILSQLDWLQTSKKAVLTRAELRPGTGFGNSVYVEIEGILYGLNKS